MPQTSEFAFACADKVLTWGGTFADVSPGDLDVLDAQTGEVYENVVLVDVQEGILRRYRKGPDGKYLINHRDHVIFQETLEGVFLLVRKNT